MTNSHSWPKRLACGLVFAGGWVACCASAQEVATDAPPALPTAGKPAAAPAPAPPSSGLIACIDPNTGELIDPIEDPACREAMESPRPAAAAVGELEEQPVEGGGFKIDLRGRFMTPLSATLRDGDVEIRHGAPALQADE